MLDKNVLSSALYTAFKNAETAAKLNNPDGDTILQIECNEISNAIYNFVISAKVTVPGLGLSAPNGAVTGTSDTGNLS